MNNLRELESFLDAQDPQPPVSRWTWIGMILVVVYVVTMLVYCFQGISQ